MLIRTLPTTLLQIFSKIILILKVSVKSILDPDNNFQEERLSINGLTSGVYTWAYKDGKRGEQRNILRNIGMNVVNLVHFQISFKYL